MSDFQSVFSHEERVVAERLREGDSVADVAADRGMDEETVERTVERVRTKTARALATLQQSPFTEDAAAALDAEERDALRDRL